MTLQEVVASYVEKDFNDTWFIMKKEYVLIRKSTQSSFRRRFSF